jgi:signal transduction histidine kinase
VNLRFHGDGDDLVITVTDHGRGIPDDDLVDIFDAFFRASNVDDVHGVGLGLTLARDFIQSHGGTLAIQSREGEGTTAIVRLPQR